MPILHYEKNNVGDMKLFTLRLITFLKNLNNKESYFLLKSIDNHNFDVYMVDVQKTETNGDYTFKLAVFDKRCDDLDFFDGKCSDSGIIKSIVEMPQNSNLSNEALEEVEAIDKEMNPSGNDAEYESDSTSVRSDKKESEIGKPIDRRMFRSELKLMQCNNASQSDEQTSLILKEMIKTLKQEDASIYLLNSSESGNTRYVLFDKNNESKLYELDKTEEDSVAVTDLYLDDLSKQEKKGLDTILSIPDETTEHCPGLG